MINSPTSRVASLNLDTVLTAQRDVALRPHILVAANDDAGRGTIDVEVEEVGLVFGEGEGADEGLFDGEVDIDGAEWRTDNDSL